MYYYIRNVSKNNLLQLSVLRVLISCQTVYLAIKLKASRYIIGCILHCLLFTTFVHTNRSNIAVIFTIRILQYRIAEKKSEV